MDELEKLIDGITALTGALEEEEADQKEEEEAEAQPS
jgi:hypothetical protein